MKVKMKIQYRKPWLFVFGAALLLLLLIVMTVAFISEDKNYVFGILCAVLSIVVLACIYFRFNYGITINEKRVVVIEQAEIKALRYDDVSSIVIKFTNESVTATIKMKKQQEYFFAWDEIYFGEGHIVLPSRNKIKLDGHFVEKSILCLSQCPKVKIQNFYVSQ